MEAGDHSCEEEVVQLAIFYQEEEDVACTLVNQDEEVVE